MSEPFGTRHAHTIGLCTYCPRLCRYACPVAEAEHSETATPWWKTTAAGLAAAGLRPLREAAALAYKCTGCRLQEEACLHRNLLPPLYQDVRTAALEAGVAPPRARTFAARMRELGNPFEANLEARLPRVAAASRGDAAVLLAVDCATLRHEAHAIEPLARVLSLAVGEAVGVRAFPGGCCGLPSLAIGDRKTFLEAARRTVEAFRGASRVVTPSPGCVVAIRESYRQAGLLVPFGIEPLVTFLHGAKKLIFQASRMKPQGSAGPVAYHDPCHLGRTLGDYDGPRAILGACGAALDRELVWTRRLSWCSGGGGAYAKVYPEGALAIAERVLADPALEDGRPIASACPSCRRMFRKIVGEERVIDPCLLLARTTGSS